MSGGRRREKDEAAAPARFSLLTVGCGKNEADSDDLARVLTANGHVQTSPDTADVIVVNTCGFIDAAKEESIDTVLAAIATARTTGARLAVVGCLVSLHQEELAGEIPEVDAWSSFGPGPVLALLDEVRRSKESAPGGGAGPGGASRRGRRPTHSYLKISDGCDTACAFCTIPRIKGRYQAVDPAQILDAGRAALAAGARELTLVGQDTARWEWPGYGDLERLLPDLHSAGAPWLRLLYLQPQNVSERLLEVLARHAVPYVDLPLQHASREILQAMGRPGDSSSYLELLERVRAALPDVAIRSTFLVGFPGETERHVEELVNFIAAAGIAVAGVFVFDPQAGTRAAALPGRVPEEDAEARAAAVNDALSAAAAQFWQRMAGREIEVLVEEGTRRDGGEAVGRTVHQAPDVDGVTYVRGSKLRRGQIVTARVDAATGWDLHAHIPEAERGSSRQDLGSGGGGK